MLSIGCFNENNEKTNAGTQVLKQTLQIKALQKGVLLFILQLLLKNDEKEAC